MVNACSPSIIFSGKKSIPIEKAVHITCVNLSEVVAESKPAGAVLVSERDDILELVGDEESAAMRREWCGWQGRWAERQVT